MDHPELFVLTHLAGAVGGRGESRDLCLERGRDEGDILAEVGVIFRLNDFPWWGPMDKSTSCGEGGGYRLLPRDGSALASSAETLDGSGSICASLQESICFLLGRASVRTGWWL